jgi:hypothetical protein
MISTYALDRHTSVLVSYAHHFCGPYLQDNPPAKGEDYFTAWISYRF